MPWIEFKQMLSGLGLDTALGRIVSIRAEDDQDIIKHFSKDQRRIRNEWLKKRAATVDKKELDSVLEQLKQGFIQLAGG